MTHSPPHSRRPSPAAISTAALVAVSLLATAAWSQEKVRLGRASARGFSTVPIDVGLEEGIFRGNGIEVETYAFAGSAKLQQAMAAGSIDMGAAGVPDLAFIVKGVPEIAVAATQGAPSMGIIVPFNSPARSADDLRGKTIGVSTVGSLTNWLALELARSRGWNQNDITTVAIGNSFAAEVAALRTGQVDAVIENAAIGLQLAKKKEGRLLILTSDYVEDFLSNAIYASNRMVRDRPETVRQFLKGWFETIAFMRADKTETVRIAREVTGFDEDVEEREYDLVVPLFSADGKFGPKALATLARSFVELKLLDREPDMSELYTEQFLPMP